MDRETALQEYKEAVADKVSAFRDRMAAYLVDHVEDLEELVKSAMKLLGSKMVEQGKEYVSFMYFSLLKTDLINRKYRILLHGLDISWYMDKNPVEIYVDAENLFAPLNEFWDELVERSQGYGAVINSYDIQHLIFDELIVIDGIICQILRYCLRDGDGNGIFEPVTRTAYWVVRWGEYRDQAEILILRDRTEQEPGIWKEKLSEAVRKPEAMVFSYWYKGVFRNQTVQGLNMKFTTFEESSLENMSFQDCDMEGIRFPKSILKGCRFEGCNLWGADFRGCTFEQTSFEGAELTAAVFPAKSVPFLDISAEQLQVILLDREGEE